MRTKMFNDDEQCETTKLPDGQVTALRIFSSTLTILSIWILLEVIMRRIF